MVFQKSLQRAAAAVLVPPHGLQGKRANVAFLALGMLLDMTHKAIPIQRASTAETDLNPASFSDLLKNPHPLPVFVAAHVLYCLLEKALDVNIYSGVLRTQPNEHRCSARVNMRHDSQLATLLGNIFLVDGHGINPERTAARVGVKILQSRVQVFCNCHADAVDDDGLLNRLVAPSVGQGFVLLWRRECGDLKTAHEESLVAQLALNCEEPDGVG